MLLPSLGWLPAKLEQHVRDGKLVEHWGQIDVVGMLAQLGFLPI